MHNTGNLKRARKAAALAGLCFLAPWSHAATLTVDCDTGNTVVKNSGRGIHIDKGSIARMLNNIVEDSGGPGISITGTSYAYIGVFIPRIPALTPNTIRNNGGVAVRCSVGGYVEGPIGTLSAAQGAKVIDSGCVDRVTAGK